MADTNKKEYTSNLHPKGDMDTTVYPNVKSENIIDKDTTAYTAGKVPDSSLVSKSLDSLSENLETTKIQVATNKNNIETLQGNYTGLQHQVNTNSNDIALTKTQVETNKANIAKNTQDIATLKTNYTEVQSQANTNSSNIALLETNVVKKDTDASLKSLTLPSSSDLKTKDGSSFGSGNSADTFNIKKELIIKDDQKPGYARFSKDLIDYYTGSQAKNFYLMRDYNPVDFNGDNLSAFDISITLQGYYSDDAVVIGSRKSTDSSYYPEVLKYGIYIGGKLQLGCNYRNQFVLQFLNRRTSSGRIPYGFILDFKEGTTITMPQKSGRLVVDDDLTAKQSTLYRHTVEIHYASNGSYFCFTGQSDKDTPIDSVEKLTTVFTNRDLCGIGVFGSEGLSKIHVGSSINDTTFKKYMNNGEYATPSEETFAIVFNTTGFTITDNVTAM